MRTSFSCVNCGTTGELEIAGSNTYREVDKIFRCTGHNPFSGHLHYQCPVCNMVLLVDPILLLDYIFTGESGYLPSKTKRRRADSTRPCLRTFWKQVFSSSERKTIYHA